MKDLENYTYVELYDMVTHIDQYKYADRLEAVRNELELRKKTGEIPDRLVPKIDLNKEDYKMIAKFLGTVLYAVILLAIGFIFVNNLFNNGLFTSFEDYLFAVNSLVALIAVIELKFSGKVKYLRIILPVYLVVSLITFLVLFGFDSLVLP